MEMDDKASATGTTDSESMDEGEFIVENILDKRFTKDGIPYFFVKWQGYDSNENTWEPLENLSKCHDLIEKFEAKQQRKAEKKRTSKKSGSAKAPQAKQKEDDDNREHDGKRAIETGWSPVVDQVAEISRNLPSQKQMDIDMYGPTFRRTWRESEEPLCILGSAVLEDAQLHLVRLKPSCPEELRVALEDVDEGVTMKNTVVVLAKEFNSRFPQLVISYYQGRVMFEDSDKTTEENTEAAARAALFHQYKENKVHVNAAPIFKDMMGDVAGYKKDEDTNDYFLNKCGDTEPYVDRTTKDGFGLPEYYSSSDESGSDGEGSGESSGDEKMYVEIKGSLLKKKRTKGLKKH